MKTQVLLVDNEDKVIGYDSIEKSHAGGGKHHRAFVTLLFDDKNQVLLQKRKHRLFDGLWDLTAISHNLHFAGHDETYQEASDRAIKKEMGIFHVEVEKMGGFNYFAKDGVNCENEYCAVLKGKYTGQFKPNRNEVYEARWVKFREFQQDLSKNPKKYTVWTQKALKILAGKNQSGFKSELGEFTKGFAKFSKLYFAKQHKLIQKYPLLISRFYKELEDFGSGGKAIRPFLVYLGYQIGQLGRAETGSDPKKIMPVCLAIELTHNFLLIHDDIIDNSQIRRGKATVHKKLGQKDNHYGVSQAIVIGDIAAFEAIKLLNLAGFSAAVKKEALDLFTSVILETAYGEALDIEYANRRPQLDKVWLVTELKTSKYSFVGPLKLGALLSGASKSQLAALTEFGFKLGKAFQIQDDILGVFGNEKLLGKSTLSDMREGKNTLLFYKARQKEGTRQRRLLDRVWGNRRASANDLERVREIMRKSGALNWCSKQMSDLVVDAKKSISSITKDDKLQMILSQLADFAVNRDR